MANEPNRIVEQRKTKLNPPAAQPLKPKDAKRGLPQTVPIKLVMTRPTPPAPPKPLNRRPGGVHAATPVPQRPMTPYAKELKEKGKNPPAQRICDLCGNTKRINAVYNRKNQIIKYEACPKCVDCTPA